MIGLVRITFICMAVIGLAWSRELMDTLLKIRKVAILLLVGRINTFKLRMLNFMELILDRLVKFTENIYAF